VAGVLLVSPEGHLIPLSFKPRFKETNNVAEYEAFLLGLQAVKNLNVEFLTTYGDSKLFPRKIRNQCQAKHPWTKDI